MGSVLKSGHRNAALLLSIAAACGVTQAGRPLATEDADVLERGTCEAEGFAARLSTSGLPAANGVTMQFGCGLGWRSQAALAYSRARSDGTTAHAWALSGKTALVEGAAGSPGLTLAWGLDAQRQAGTSIRHETSFLNLVATRAWAGDWLTHANLGWLRSESASMNTTTWNLAIEKPVGAGVELMAEAYGDDRTRPWLGAGLRWALTESFSLDGSWSVQNTSPRTRLWTLGFKLAF